MPASPIRSALAAALALLIAAPALAQPASEKKKDEDKVPERQLPAAVLTGVKLVERQFEKSLADDCDPERCFPKGCVYVNHTVVDRPATASLPGLGLDPGPGTGEPQVYLTSVECAFTHERSVKNRDVKALAKRLEAKLSQGWTEVDVVFERLDPVPDSLAEPPEVFDASEFEDEKEEEKEPEPKVEEPPPEWNAEVAAREFWLSVLPHFPWMIGLLLFTLVALLLIWAFRRLGRTSPEEQALLASLMANPGGAADDDDDDDDGDEPPDEPPPTEDESARVSARHQAWKDRLAQSDVQADTALHVLINDLLRTGERRLLAKAVILFPEMFHRAFPQGGDFASAKFELAEFLKHADPEALPSDAAFFDKLDRYAMSAALTAQPDTELIRSLHDDFGAAALVDLVGELPPRHGALLFATSPEAMQHEAVRRIHPGKLAELVDQLMRSNRMDPNETSYLLEVLSATRQNQPMPAPPVHSGVSDRGSAFDAPASLSVMLPHLDGEFRATLVDAALQRNAGHLPAWMQTTLFGEMLLRLPDESRTDLLLEVPVEQLDAWLRVQTDATRNTLKSAMPNALRAALSGITPPASDEVLHALAADGRAAISSSLLRRVARSGTPFHQLLA